MRLLRFENILQLPSMPDMTFARNYLSITHRDGFGLEFNALDALRRVSKEPLDLEVGVAKAWQGARSDCQFAKRNVVKPWDWTYSSDFQGNLLPADGQSKQLVVSETTERIDIEKLKRKDEILYYEDVDLYEDELADHGVAHLSVKIVSSCNCMVRL